MFTDLFSFFFGLYKPCSGILRAQFQDIEFSDLIPPSAVPNSAILVEVGALYAREPARLESPQASLTVSR